MSQPTMNEARFLKEIAQHQMTVVRDDGIYRHIRFSKPRSSNQCFDLITWPGHLCYTGDMGTFVFSRLTDMFEFFREPNPERGLSINPYYWSEKVLAADSCDGIQEYCHDKFIAAVNEWVTDHIESYMEDDPEAAAALREAVQDEVLECDSNEIRAFDAANNFKHGDFEFTDFWEVDCKKYTVRYLWCCYALVWGIQQYDASKIKEGE